MKNNEEHTTWVNDVLNSFDGMNRVEANPFLYTKIQQRLLNTRQQSTTYGRWMYRLAFMLIVLLAVNIYSYSSFIKTQKNNSNVTGIEAFVTDYEIQTDGDNI